MLNKHNFEIAELAPQDEDRLTLCGIYVTPNGTHETDGHQAVMVTDVTTDQPNLFAEFEDVTPADTFTPFILDRESALKIAKAIPKKSSSPAGAYAVVDGLSEGSDKAQVSVNDIFRQEVLRAKKIEGQFPDVLRVFPDKDAATLEIWFNIDRLIALLRTLKKFADGHERESVVARFYGQRKVVRFDIEGEGQNIAAALMPMRADGEQEQD
jgi:hypothetical protein